MKASIHYFVTWPEGVSHTFIWRIFFGFLLCMAVIAESKAADWYINDGVGSKTFELTGPSEVSLAEQFCEVYGDWVSNGSADSSYHHSGRYYDISGLTMSFDLKYEFGCHNESSSPVHITWHTIPHFQMIRYAVPAGPSEPEDLGGSCQVYSTMPSPLVLDPIHSKTGNSFQIDVDFNDGAKGLLKFTRYYNSASEKYPESIMGNGWRHTYERRILRKNYNYVTAIRPDGKGHVWKNNGLGYVSESDKSSKLSFVNWNWWVLETKDGWKETYDAFGKLLSLEHISGESIDLTYNERSQLATLTDNVGRYIELTYNSLGKLESFRDTTGNIYKYEYGAEGNLTGVIYPDLTQSDDSDNPKKTYHYENVDHPTYLTGITNENGVRYASWTYDDQGRAISNEHAGIEVGSLQYVDGNNTVVSGSLGEQRTIASVTINKISRPASISRKACANCAVDTQSYTFDTNGYLSAKVDWNGFISEYLHSENGLELSRTEAASTAQERTISTEWHPDFRKPVRIAEPRRIIEYTYDSAGRVLSRTERAIP